MLRRLVPLALFGIVCALRQPSAVAARPLPPTDLAATPLSDTAIHLTWTDNSFNEAWFIVQRASSPTGRFHRVAKLSSNLTSYDVVGLAPVTSYFFRVRAVGGGGGRSRFSNVTTAATFASGGGLLNPPAIVTGAPVTCTQINMNWTPATEAGSGLGGYRIYRDGSPIALTRESTFSDAQLPPATAHTYAVSTVDILGRESPPSQGLLTGTSSCTVNIPPVAIVDASTPATLAGASLTLDASASVDLDGSIAAFAWEFGDGTAAQGEAVSHVYAAGGTYRVTLTVVDDRGGRASDSALVAVASGVSEPAAPDGLTAAVTSGHSVTLSWADHSSDELLFDIERAPSPTGPWTHLVAASRDAQGYSDEWLASSAPYVYRIRAFSLAGVSAYSNLASATTLSDGGVPDPPLDVMAVPVSASEIDLLWRDSSMDEAGFVIERAPEPSGPWTIATTTAAGATACSITLLSSSTTYYFRVRSYNEHGDSIDSNIASATTQAGPSLPNAPTNLVASASGASRIDLMWVGQSDDESGFKVERAESSSGLFVEIGTPTAAAWSDTGLEAATTYTYRVRAYNGVGESDYSNLATATTSEIVPAAPQGLTTAAVSSSQINLGWTDMSSNEAGFRIEIASAASGPWTQAGVVGANVTSYASTGLAPATTYFHRIRAFNSAGDSSPSNTASATTLSIVTVPGSPLALSALAVSSSQINLGWTDTSANETGFRIETASAASGPWTQAGVVGANVTSYASTGLNQATTHFYRVRAYNSAGDSSPSNTASATTLSIVTVPVSPLALSAVPVSSSQINLGWTDTSANETGFRIETASAASGPWIQAGVVGANVTSYASTGLNQATTHFYRVRAYNSAGDSGPSNTASATTLSIVTVPDPPLALSADAVSSSQINLGWTDTSANETGFRIETASAASGPWTQAGVVGANVTSYASTGLTQATTYFYRVRAYNSAGDSSPSNTASATTLSIVTVPDPPLALSALAVSSSEIDISWTDTSANETGFRIETASAASGPWTQAGVVGANVTSYASTGLTQATIHFYRVRAYNSAGDSSPSNTASATTLSIVTVPDPPLALSALAVSSSEIDISWTDGSANETGFRIETASATSGPWTQAGVVGANVTSYASTGLTQATTHFYRVRAYNSAGDSGPSNTASATTLSIVTVPDPPLALSAVAVSSSQINLGWTDTSANETGFRIETASAASGPWTQAGVVGANVTNYASTGLTQATTHFYRVRAYNSAGDSSPSNTASATTLSIVTVPDPPLALSALAVSASEIDISWTDGSANETGFRIETASATSGPWTQAGVVGANVTSYASTGLTQATTHFYRVRAYNSAGDSGPSNTASATTLSIVTVPDPPLALSAVAISSSQINLGWTDTSANETGFRIETASAASGPWIQAGVVGANVTNYASTGLTQATTHFYRVRAYNSAGDSSPSNTASATTLSIVTVPDPPLALSALAVSASEIDISWTDGSANETGFKIERAATPSGPFTQIATRSANTTSYADMGLGASTGYSYRVRAYNSTGDSAYSNIATATTSQGSTDTIPPSVPQDVTILAPGCGKIALSWSPSSDTGGSGLKGYNIYRSGTFVKQVPASATSAEDSGLPPANYVSYTLSAVDVAGNQSARTPSVGIPTQACTGSGGGDHIWSKSFGSFQLPDNGFAIVSDRSGNVFVAGEFQRAVDFGSGEISSDGGRDIFVAKYAPDGRPLWSKQFGGIYDDTARALAVDTQGNLFVTGLFQQTCNFGGHALTSAGGYDIFLAKLSGTDGRPQWSKRLGGTGDDRADGLAVDSRGDAVITGQFKGTVDFGDGPVTNTSSYVQAFLAKYSGADGGHLWSRRFGQLYSSATSTFGSGQGVALGPDDAPVITGYFKGNVDFGTGPLPNAGGLDIFLAKFSASGAPLWAHSFGSVSDDHGLAVAVDPSANVAITGDFLGAADFGAGPLASTRNAETIFLASFAPNGTPRWSQSFVASGVNAGSHGYGLATDASANVVLSGSISGPVDLGGGRMPVIGTVFLAKYSSAGAPLWAKLFNGHGGRGRGLDVDPDDRVLLAGTFEGDIDLGGGTYRTTGGVSTDIFVLKAGP